MGGVDFWQAQLLSKDQHLADLAGFLFVEEVTSPETQKFEMTQSK